MHSIIRDHRRIYSFFISSHSMTTTQNREETALNTTPLETLVGIQVPGFASSELHVQKASKWNVTWFQQYAMVQVIVPNYSTTKSFLLCGRVKCPVFAPSPQICIVHALILLLDKFIPGGVTWGVIGWGLLIKHILPPLLEPRVLFLLSSGSSNNLKSLSLPIFIFLAFQGRKWKILNC